MTSVEPDPETVVYDSTDGPSRIVDGPAEHETYVLLHSPSLASSLLFGSEESALAFARERNLTEFVTVRGPL